ncbi:hypothetical protein SAMN05216275_10586 [Streptosporangium canum]|uniref:Uncharacterized protein n=1 Tax=Streptosporangium canum TaxID=324952 RepID=A0A1I3LBS9_9ACTN|nr:hypothetical protein [Streptosporangium canum]SFI82213.1 hypothetical protein SAMN05216275_10586 [Streptosporangium canum]
MTDANCGPGGFCGYCEVPCFLRGQEDESFSALLERGPEGDFEEFSEDLESSDSEALGCPRWDDPDADCDECDVNFFCFNDYESPEA